MIYKGMGRQRAEGQALAPLPREFEKKDKNERK
jgi:hypothetical protein